ncbi:MAG: hypothetical protein AVDCRST_MAG64-160, partial [uncultured Phycisphaerae bacterium]
ESLGGMVIRRRRRDLHRMQRVLCCGAAAAAPRAPLPAERRHPPARLGERAVAVPRLRLRHALVDVGDRRRHVRRRRRRRELRRPRGVRPRPQVHRRPPGPRSHHRHRLPVLRLPEAPPAGQARAAVRRRDGRRRLDPLCRGLRLRLERPAALGPPRPTAGAVAGVPPVADDEAVGSVGPRLHRRLLQALRRGRDHRVRGRRRHVDEPAGEGHARVLRRPLRRAGLPHVRARQHGDARRAGALRLRHLQRRQLGHRRQRVPRARPPGPRDRTRRLGVLRRERRRRERQVDEGRERGEADLHGPRPRRAPDDHVQQGAEPVHPPDLERHGAAQGGLAAGGGRPVEPRVGDAAVRGPDPVGALVALSQRGPVGRGRPHPLPAADAGELAERRRAERQPVVRRRLREAQGRALRLHDPAVPARAQV